LSVKQPRFPSAKALSLFFSAALFFQPAFAEPKSTEEPPVLIRRASQLSDIWSTGPVRLRMRMRYFEGKTSPTDADYEKISTSWKRWRATISSPRFKGISVGGEDRVWEWPNASETPLHVWQFERALAALSQSVLDSHLEYTVTLRQLEEGKEKAQCVVTRDGGRVLQDCFDPATGLLVAVQEGPWTYFYSEYQPFGSKFFPRNITVFETSTLVAMARVVTLESPPTVDPKLFEPAQDAASYLVCQEALGLPLGAKGGNLVHEVNPNSTALPNTYMTNEIAVSGILGRDGKPRNLSAEGRDPLINSRALEAVQQWQFEPFTVCGNPVEMPLSFQMNFSSTGHYLSRSGP
jgi:hypothetical protein